MKGKIWIIALAAVMGISSACNKDKDPVSKVVTLPYIELNGDKFITVNVGGSVSDAGAKLVNDVNLEGQSNLTAVENTFDATTPGLYYMLYEAETNNGYHVYAARYIAVTNYADNNDLSGVYERTSNGVQVNLTRKSRGLYETDDMGGAGLHDALYFTVVNDTTIVPGPQFSETIHTEIYADNAKLIRTPTDTSYKYVLHAPGYGTAVRTFVKVQ